MKELEFINSIREKIEKMGIELTDIQSKRFYLFMQLLIEWNKKINLTAIIEPEEIILKHFIDSITVLPYLSKSEKILDVGTGAGFPGIPLKIMQENKNFTLLDSLNKRILFLQTVIDELELSNIEAIHGRAEDFIKEKRECFDIVTSRAVARLNILLEYMLPFIKIGGYCICMKSIDIEEELNEASKAIQVLGGQIEKVDTISLPNSNIKRNIIIIRKIKTTPNQYPRKAGTPEKKPII